MFEALYEAHAKRKAIERCNAVKDAIIAGIWGNSNYDEDKGSARRELLETIEEQFQNAIRQIMTGEEPEDDKIDWDDPFFAAMKGPRAVAQPPGVGQSDTPEAKEQKRMMDSLDQT